LRSRQVATSYPGLMAFEENWGEKRKRDKSAGETDGNFAILHDYQKTNLEKERRGSNG